MYIYIFSLSCTYTLFIFIYIILIHICYVYIYIYILYYKLGNWYIHVEVEQLWAIGYIIILSAVSISYTLSSICKSFAFEENLYIASSGLELIVYVLVVCFSLNVLDILLDKYETYRNKVCINCKYVFFTCYVVYIHCYVLLVYLIALLLSVCIRACSYLFVTLAMLPSNLMLISPYVTYLIYAYIDSLGL